MKTSEEWTAERKAAIEEPVRMLEQVDGALAQVLSDLRSGIRELEDRAGIVLPVYVDEYDGAGCLWRRAEYPQDEPRPVTPDEFIGAILEQLSGELEGRKAALEAVKRVREWFPD